MAIRELWIPSQHYSASRGAYNKAAFHTTQGAMKIRDLGAWFQNPAAGCSSHHGADNFDAGLLGAYVYENHAAWTQGNANGVCLSLEMCAYAEWSRSTWLGKPVLLNNAADWLRHVTSKYGIPYTVLNDSQAQNPSTRGICQHVNLGAWGSGHWDCGDGFPLDEVIRLAKGTAPPPAQEVEMALTDDDIARIWRWAMNAEGKQAWNELDAIWKSLGKDSLTYDDITHLWTRAVDSTGLAAYAAIARIHNHTAALVASSSAALASSGQPVDEAALASALTPVIAEGIGSGADAAAIAASVAALFAGKPAG